MRRLLLVAAMLLTVGGCTQYIQYWARPGGTEAAFEVAASNCENAAQARFPPVTFGVPGYFANPNTYCMPTSGGPSCEIVGPGYLPQARSAADTNAGARETAFQQCMLAEGWRLFSPAALPPPPLSPPPPGPDAAIGQALTYCEKIFNGKPNSGAAAAKFNQCVTTRTHELSGPRPPA